MALPAIIADGRTRLFAAEGPTIAFQATARARTVELPQPVELNVVIPDQARSNWCWAAAAVGIAAAYGDTLTQCDVASAVTSKVRKTTVTCCFNGSRSDCDDPRPLSFALKLTGHEHLGRFLKERPDNPWDFIVKTIVGGNPIAVRLGFPATDSGHIIVVTGYDVDQDGGAHAIFGDPASVTGTVPLKHLLNGYLGGFWHSAYVTSGKRPVPRK